MMSERALKNIVYACMIADHIGQSIISDEQFSLILHAFGLITAPVMFFFVAEGFSHTKSIKKYMTRLLVLAFFSQEPFFRFMGSKDPFYLNIVFTLALSLAGLWLVNSRQSLLIKGAGLAVIALLSTVCDFGIFGIAYTLGFGLTPDRKKGIGVFVLISMVKILVIAGQVNIWPYVFSTMAASGLLLIYNGKGRVCRWERYIGYAIYPLQFVLLNIIRGWRGV